MRLNLFGRLLLVGLFFTTAAQAAVIDVHVHPTSAALAKRLPFTEPLNGSELLAEMNRNGIDIAFMLSGAYTYFVCGATENPIIKCAQKDVRAYVEEENDFVLAQAALAPDRLLPFCSFPLNARWALEELDRCYKHGAKGLKIHLANHRMDLANAEWRTIYQTIVDQADKYGMIVLVHPYLNGTQDSWTEFFSSSIGRNAPIIFAHGLDPYWRNFQMFNIVQPRSVINNVYTDLSGLMVSYPGAPIALRQEMLWYLRQAGMSQLLFASDLPAFSQKDTLDSIRGFTDPALGKFAFTYAELSQFLGGNAEALLQKVGIAVRNGRMVFGPTTRKPE